MKRVHPGVQSPSKRFRHSAPTTLNSVVQEDGWITFADVPVSATVQRVLNSLQHKYAHDVLIAQATAKQAKYEMQREAIRERNLLLANEILQRQEQVLAAVSAWINSGQTTDVFERILTVLSDIEALVGTYTKG